MKILVVMPLDDSHKESLESIPGLEICYSSYKDVTKEDAKDACVILGNIKPEYLSACQNLKLLQLNSAGTDGYTTPGVLPAGAVLANATGAYGLALSEHMVGAVLFMIKNFYAYSLNQEKHVWQDEGPVVSIQGSKTLVIGLGNIGCEFAKRMHALGSTVSGIKRNPNGVSYDYISHIYDLTSLHKALSDADIVASVLPNTKETIGIFDDKAFSAMKKGAYFMNLGRGNTVDQDALYNHLTNGHLAGAHLDVTTPEPLPSDHKLWDAPNIFITPHISGGFHLKNVQDTIVEIVSKNIRHLMAGEDLENLVDMKTGYMLK